MSARFASASERGTDLPTSQSSFEPFVDAIKAGNFLSLRPRRILELARARQLPAHPVGLGKRKQWRFRLSELANAVSTNQATIPNGSPLAPTWRKHGSGA
jgi:hypothetical protein